MVATIKSGSTTSQSGDAGGGGSGFYATLTKAAQVVGAAINAIVPSNVDSYDIQYYRNSVLIAAPLGIAKPYLQIAADIPSVGASDINISAILSNIKYKSSNNLINSNPVPVVTPTPDTTPPTFTSAIVANSNPSVVMLGASEILDTTASLLASSITIAGHVINSLAYSGNQTVLATLATPFVYGEAARVGTYVLPVATANQIKDVAGNAMLAFSTLGITNNVAAVVVGDTTPPTAVSAAVANSTPTQTIVTMSEAMASATLIPGSVTIAGHTVSAFAATGNTLVITHDAFVYGEAARSVVYTKPSTGFATDVALNALASFTLAITNNVGATTAVPTAPTSFATSVTAGTGLVDGTWVAPTSLGSALIEYEISDNLGRTQTISAPLLNGRMNGLNYNGTTAYTYKVRARNTTGWGPYSNTSVATPAADTYTYDTLVLQMPLVIAYGDKLLRQGTSNHEWIKVRNLNNLVGIHIGTMPVGTDNSATNFGVAHTNWVTLPPGGEMYFDSTPIGQIVGTIMTVGDNVSVSIEAKYRK